MPIPYFDPTATTFSLGNAYYFALASSAAYTSNPGPALTGFNLSAPVQTCAANNLSAFVASGNANADLIVAFRGTNNIPNWLTDGCIEQVADNAYPGKVHKGFAQTMNDLWPLISAKLPHTSSARVWVTGHSLGGAMATLAALRLATEGLDVRGVYTFGSPRVGNDEFYAKYSVPHYRLVNNNDVVPHVPLETTLVGLRLFTYKHVGTLEYLDRNGLLGGGMSNWDVKKAFMIDALLRAGGPWPEAAADHFIRNYIAAIEANF